LLCLIEKGADACRYLQTYGTDLCLPSFSLVYNV